MDGSYVRVSSSPRPKARDVAEMSTYRSQMGVGLNLIVSMVTIGINIVMNTIIS